MTTTVAMDFGRVSLDKDLILYLFGTPGQHRFWFMWDDLVRGAIGAVVMVDTRRIDEAFAPIDFFEDRDLPYVIAVNCFDGLMHHRAEEVRDALTIDAVGADNSVRRAQPAVHEADPDHAGGTRAAPAFVRLGRAPWLRLSRTDLQDTA